MSIRHIKAQAENYLIKLKGEKAFLKGIYKAHTVLIGKYRILLEEYKNNHNSSKINIQDTSNYIDIMSEKLQHMREAYIQMKSYAQYVKNQLKHFKETQKHMNNCFFKTPKEAEEHIKPLSMTTEKIVKKIEDLCAIANIYSRFEFVSKPPKTDIARKYKEPTKKLLAIDY